MYQNNSIAQAECKSSIEKEKEEGSPATVSVGSAMDISPLIGEAVTEALTSYINAWKA